MERFKVEIPIWSFKKKSHVDKRFIWDTGASRCLMPEKVLKDLAGVSLMKAIKIWGASPKCVFMRTLAGYSVCIGYLNIEIALKVFVKDKGKFEEETFAPEWYFIPDTTDHESTHWSLRIARKCIKSIVERIKDKLEYERIKKKIPPEFFKKYIIAYGLVDDEVSKEKIIAELVTDWNEANYIIENEYECDGILSVSEILSLLERQYEGIEFDESKVMFIAEKKIEGITML